MLPELRLAVSLLVLIQGCNCVIVSYFLDKNVLSARMTCGDVSLQKIGILVLTKPVQRGQRVLSSFTAHDKAVLEFPLPAPVCMPRLFVTLNAETIHL